MNTNHNTEGRKLSFIEQAKMIDGLDVEYAIALMNGSVAIYQKVMKVAAHTIPSTIDRLKEFLEKENLPDYAIVVHGLKGAMNSIGARRLGADALELELASKRGDLAFCVQKTDGFIESLRSFHQAICELGSGDSNVKQSGSLAVLAEKLPAAAEAAENFDSVTAQSIIRELSRASYGEKIDLALKQIENSLEEFECDTGAEQIWTLLAGLGQEE